MRRLALVFVLSTLAATLVGCVVVTPPPRHHVHRAYVRGATCPPSHYWDGYVCRHRGEGRGARKHDRNVHQAVPVR
jgi:hypothetical protein